MARFKKRKFRRGRGFGGIARKAIRKAKKRSFKKRVLSIVKTADET